ncbi:unnamed protein product [Adineta steineri]|uniref:F-box domain-containing protein n=1 Tax=Adineta steineri TaxID=433720 RepID=A0A814LR12_9BILA|nr:unnamed protein product [Adineta steineri]CAF3978006.1 unnamed protein product [Adineta steineri]
MSQTNFNKRSINIFRPYINRIISLQLSKPFFIKNFFTSFPIDTSFNRLESLVLNDFNVNDDLSILISLRQLPRLFSLKIFCHDCNKLYIIFQSICRLPVLKYAKLLLSNWSAIYSFPPATSDDQRRCEKISIVNSIKNRGGQIGNYQFYFPQHHKNHKDTINYSIGHVNELNLTENDIEIIIKNAFEAAQKYVAMVNMTQFLEKKSIHYQIIDYTVDNNSSDEDSDEENCSDENDAFNVLNNEEQLSPNNTDDEEEGNTMATDVPDTAQKKFNGCRIYDKINPQQSKKYFRIRMGSSYNISIRRWLSSFNDFASFIAIVGFKLELLRISIFHQPTLLDSYQWQQLILHRMPRLHTFLLYYHGPLIRDVNDNNHCRTLLDQFSSRFWIERRWFFAHRHCNCFSQYGSPFLAFYSTQIRWLNFCETDDFLNNNICSCQDPIFNLSVGPRMPIHNRKVVANFPFQFPRVTELELAGNDRININSFIDNLSHIIILTNITYLNISFNNQWLNCFIKLLNHMPSVQKLVLNVQSSSEMEVSSDQQTNTADLVCNNNVRNVKIIGQLPLVTVQLINKLFPRMECLWISNTKIDLISFLRTLLSNRIHNSHLSSFIAFSGDDIIIEPLKTMIDNEKLLDNYNIEHRNCELCLWW